jgi:hypothetical protein
LLYSELVAKIDWNDALGLGFLTKVLQNLIPRIDDSSQVACNTYKGYPMQS